MPRECLDFLRFHLAPPLHIISAYLTPMWT
jgi:hypothetical protein